MNARVSIPLLVFGLALSRAAAASDIGYLYGRVATVDGKAYVGELRWGDEESFWDDLFNADKPSNQYLTYVNDNELDRMRWLHWEGWGELFGDRDPSFAHSFAVRFGDLKRIDVGQGNELTVTFRNGDEQRLAGGSNDVGALITVVDPGHGRREIRWNRIRTIEFGDAPAKLDDKLGEPIYGTVTAGKVRYTGRIQWDNDECLSIDKLDGDSRDHRESIPFGDIARIRKHERGARVTLTSGEELYLTGTNDVNHENRGIVVVEPGIGSVKVGWDDFDEVTFAPAPTSGDGYAEFAGGRDLAATVVTRNGRYDGRIVYDLDESRDSELLNGTTGDTEYLIPFRNIARIKPSGAWGADVELRVGVTIALEKDEDVSRSNEGLLVFTSGKPTYVPWRDVTEIVFH